MKHSRFRNADPHASRAITAQCRNVSLLETRNRARLHLAPRFDDPQTLLCANPNSSLPVLSQYCDGWRRKLLGDFFWGCFTLPPFAQTLGRAADPEIPCVVRNQRSHFPAAQPFPRPYRREANAIKPHHLIVATQPHVTIRRLRQRMNRALW